MEANAIISNVETIKRIVEAIELDKPLIDKDITVGGRVHNPDIFMNVPIGLPIVYLLKKQEDTLIRMVKSYVVDHSQGVQLKKTNQLIKQLGVY